MKSKEISNEDEERCSCINEAPNCSQNEEKQEEIEEKAEIDYDKLTEDQLNKEIDRLSTPFWVSKLIVNFPIIIICTVFSIMIAVTVIVIATGAATPKETYYRDPLVLGSKLVNDYDIIYLTQKAVEESFPGGLQPLRTMKQGDFQTFILFECTSCDTILTVDFVKKMFEIEQKIYQHKSFNNFCLAKSTSDSSCSPYSYLSFTRNFPNMDTLAQSQIDSVLAYMITNETFYHNNYFYFENSFDKTNLKSKKARAIFTFATPIEIDGVRYSTSSDRFFDQAAKFVEFSYSMESDVYSVQTSLNVRFYNGYWAQDLIKKWIIEDFKLIIFSFIIVFVYVSFQTQSMFLTSIKLCGVALAYPFSIFIGRYIFQITYFGYLNLVSIFIVLGVATDSIFVFVDCWKQTATYERLHLPEYSKYEVRLRRMSYTWRRTSKAILTTNLATACAFLSNGLSLIMPFCVFGYFSCVLVILVYCFAMICSPCCVVIYERYLANRCRYGAFIRRLVKHLYLKLSLVLKLLCCKKNQTHEACVNVQSVETDK